ncbi:MAG: hypothetical protein ACK452_09880, partial [Bacteroidota bacterium]
MKKELNIEKKLKKDKLIKEYFNEASPQIVYQFIDELPKKAESIARLIKNEQIDYLHLAAIADVLCKKRNEDLAMLRHSRN